MSNLGQADRHSNDRDPDLGRVKTETGSLALSKGQSFRAFQEFSLISGASLVIQVVSPIDFIISAIILSVDSGEIKYTSIGGATEATPFTPVTNIFPKNTRSDIKEPYVGKVTAGQGGTYSGGLVTDTAKVKTGTNAQRFSIVEQAQGERGVGAGTYYIVLENTSGSQAAEGVFYAHWNEL